MALLPLQLADADENLEADRMNKDFDIEQYYTNQQWSMLGKALEIYLLWILTLVIVYALTFAVIMYVRAQKIHHATGGTQGREEEQTSGDTVVSLNDKDLYPILNVAGDQSSVYFKYLDVDRISKSNNTKAKDIEQREQARGHGHDF